jgi:hypothetical protein
MRKKHKSELERSETWDSNKVEIRKPKRPSRVVFSVAFKRDDFDLVSKYAELSGKKTSEFIRDAAIEKTFLQGEFAWFMFDSGSQIASWIIDKNEMPQITAASGSQTEPTLIPS